MNTESHSNISDLKVSGSWALLYCVLAAALTGLGVTLSVGGVWWHWLVGQLVLAIGCTLWFSIMHECGHKTFSGNKILDFVGGHIASLFCVIPFECWRYVHHGHHLWTGWRDRDPTTKGMLPRPIGRFERMVFNTCWRLWIPIFSLAYRVTIFWNLSKMRRLYPRRRLYFAINVVALALVYSCAAPWLLNTFGLALLIHFIVMDPILIGQHSQIPQFIAGPQIVRPFAKEAQYRFTRSVLLLPWVSKWIFLGFDRHGLHHAYTHVPGYLLHKMNHNVGTVVSWMSWIKSAKRVPAHILIFGDRGLS